MDASVSFLFPATTWMYLFAPVYWWQWHMTWKSCRLHLYDSSYFFVDAVLTTVLFLACWPQIGFLSSQVPFQKLKKDQEWIAITSATCADSSCSSTFRHQAELITWRHSEYLLSLFIVLLLLRVNHMPFSLYWAGHVLTGICYHTSHQEGSDQPSGMMMVCSSRILSLRRHNSSDEELMVLPWHPKVI
jgi:hypothetical protein